MERLGPGKIALDTAVFIYFIEADPRWQPMVAALFQSADRGHRELVTSTLTLLELLVVPYRAGNDGLAARYEALLTRSRGIRLVEMTRDQMRRAGRLRAATSIRTPDALQIAAGLEAGCTTFVTNGRRLPRVEGLAILQLSEFGP